MSKLARNILKSFRFTTEEWSSLERNARNKEMNVRNYIVNLNNNSQGVIDKEGLKILFSKIFEPKFAKKMIKKYCT